MTDLNALKTANASRWANCKILKPGTFNAVAKHLIAPEAKAHYQSVSAKTGVPWAFIAVAHERESGQNFAGSLAQGDPWNQVSTHVPKNRGPFRSWEEAAVDALVNCAPFAARNLDWSVGGTLTMLEQYNGLGYATRGLPSPYIWSGTDQYRSGKFVADHVFDPNAVDQQLGCAGLLMAMMVLDPTITFTGAMIAPIKPVPHPVPAPTANRPSTNVGSFWAIIPVMLIAAGAAIYFFGKDKIVPAIAKAKDWILSLFKKK
jgi:lysozyme family protein